MMQSLNMVEFKENDAEFEQNWKYSSTKTGYTTGFYIYLEVLIKICFSSNKGDRSSKYGYMYKVSDYFPNVQFLLKC